MKRETCANVLHDRGKLAGPGRGALPKSCPRCQRALPPAATKVCVYCGAALVRGSTDPAARTVQPATADPLVGLIISERFKIEDLIGQGGMGKVYRARHLALDRTVVLKMLKPQLLEDPTLVGRFEREAKAASRLNHPNVIQVLDFGRLENDGTLYIVMEYVQGKDLRLVLRDEWPLAEERLCDIMAQVCSALGEAHVNNVIHRDLKPENIMVEARRDQPDHVKVLDFGIAKILDSEVSGLTRHDVVCGTPQYMAPEQATGSALDERSDLYGLGVILYQMTTGHLPFDGANSMEVLTRHVNESPIPPRQKQPDAPISEPMERLILRALEKDPAKRPQTAEQFREALLAVPAQARAAARAATPTRSSAVPRAPAGGPRRPQRVLWLAAAATAALLVVGVAAAMRGGSVRETAPLPPPPVADARRDSALIRDLLTQATRREQSGDLLGARELLEAAITAEPDSAEAHYRLAGLLMTIDPDRARSEYELSRKLDPMRYGESVARILDAPPR
jgi:tRNA A-37 threonylcarbamoyl transferase component Bud32